MYHLIIVHYGEIGLKGNNRCDFENQLIANLRKALASEELETIKRLDGRLAVLLNQHSDIPSMMERASKVLGVEWLAPAVECEEDVDDIWNAIKGAVKRLPKANKIRVETKRSDKNFEMNSMQLSSYIGGKLVSEFGFAVDLTRPDLTVYIEILKGRVLIYFQKMRGPGGLPVGSSGKVLSLFSGGIDSPVAAYMMMKRGCNLDFLHIHLYTDNKEVLGSKIGLLAKKLNEYQFGCNLYLAPYREFKKRTAAVPGKKEVVLFRRFIVKLANSIAEENDMMGIVTGDNLGQVASQTLENLLTTTDASQLPIYRPLLTYDKREITDIAKKIGTYELSISPYKDCCSLIAEKHPETKTKIADMEAIEEKIKIEEVIEQTLKLTEKFRL